MIEQCQTFLYAPQANGVQAHYQSNISAYARLRWASVDFPEPLSILSAVERGVSLWNAR
jgi:hypothetical protein